MIGKQQDKVPYGFTVLEVLATLIIIALLVTLTVSRTRNTLQDTEIITALNQMAGIRDAVAEGFYADFGFVPEEAHNLPGMENIDIFRNQNPEYVTRFLCLEKDCTDQDIKACLEDGDPWYFSLEEDILGNGHRYCYFMARALSHLVAQAQEYDFEKILPLLSDPTIERGWSGPYLEPNAWINATALNRQDDEKYLDDFYSDANEVQEDALFPVITTPWADDLEAAALEAETKEDEDDAALEAELRKGKYYQILVYSRFIPANFGGGTTSRGRWEQVPETAVIICRGADGLPGSDSQAERLGAEDYWMQCADMNKYGLTDEQRHCFERLKITDPNDPDYVDIGDDMVLFIFGSGPVRSPLER